MPLKEFLSFSISIAGELHDFHNTDLVYGNICPENIILEPETRKPTLINSTSIITGQSPIKVGHLPYMSPEQTGRMKRGIDFRSDLYSLGSVFYELLTGLPPFISSDMLGVVHSHIAKTPKPLHELNADVPVQISAIVMRLLEKNPEDRYQTALGLQKDLEKCDGQLTSKGRIENFKLGGADFSGRLQFSQKLIGREDELKTLLNYFEKSSQGAAELVLVSGFSGVGKSTLVHEVQRHVNKKQGYFIKGKFNQSQNIIPYSAWGQAFNELVTCLLMENEKLLTTLRKQILEEIGPNGKVLTGVISNIESVIGPQPNVPELKSLESQNRFNQVFQGFIKVIAQKEHPIIIFLDDLQWIDLASLNLLKILISDLDQTNFMIIGAYRENEICATHPLMSCLVQMQRENIRFKQIKLDNLSETNLKDMVAYTLNCDPAYCERLSQIIYRKTLGNPFFTLEMLQVLFDKNILVPNKNARCWQWDIDELQGMSIADNVVELVVNKIRQYSPTTQEVLKFAACMDGQFDLATLSIVTQKPESVIRMELQPALRDEVIYLLSDRFKFAHDRIQQAVMSLIEEDSLKNIHQQIGYLLLTHTPESQLKDKVFSITYHLNQALEKLDKDEDRLELAKLNLRTGRKALKATAFEAAYEYFKQGVESLPHSEPSSSSLSFFLYEGYGQCQYLLGDFEGGERIFLHLLSKINDRLKIIKLTVFRIDQYSRLARFNEAIQLGLDALMLFGISFPEGEASLKNKLQAEFEETEKLLARKSVNDLINLPAMNDPCQIAISELYYRLLGPLINAGRGTLTSLTYTLMIKLSLMHGQRDVIALAYAYYPSLLIPHLEDYERSYEYGQLAIDLSQRSNNPFLLGSVANVVSIFTWHFKKHMRHSAEVYETGFKACLRSGNLYESIWNRFNSISTSFYEGKRLDLILEEFTDGIRYAEKINTKELALKTWFPLVGVVASLMGKTDSIDSIDYLNIKETKYIEMLENEKIASALTIYYSFKIIKLFICGRYQDVLNAVDKFKEFNFIPTTLYSIEPYFYICLSYIQAYPDLPPDQKQSSLQKIIEYQTYFNNLAQCCAENFLHKSLLINAEIARLFGKEAEAMKLYEQAIVNARKNGFIHNEAIANELAGCFYQGIGVDTVAGFYLERAQKGYGSWGAQTKVKEMEESYVRQWDFSTSIAQNGIDNSSLELSAFDLSSAIKASQAFSGEIVLNKLLTKMIRIVIENAGAQKGFLILKREDDWVVEAEGNIDDNGIEVMRSVSIEKNDEILSRVIHYVIRTHEHLIVSNASNNRNLIDDIIDQQNISGSILCLPLINLGRVSGVLYLENRQADDCFTSNRVEFLNLLSSQMAMALDNAILYDQMSDLNQSLENSLQRSMSYFDMPLVGSVISSLDKKFVDVNQEMCRITGYSKKELLKKTWAEITHPEDLGIDVGLFDDIASGERNNYSIEKRFIRKDGQIINTEIFVSCVRLNDGNVDYFIAMVNDISIRKKQEAELEIHRNNLERLVEERTKELKASNDKLNSEVYERKLVEERFDLALKGSADGFWDWTDIEKEGNWFSPRFFELLGYENNEFPMVFDSFFSRLHPDDRGLVEKAVELHFKGRDLYDVEYRLKTKSGKYKWFRARGQATWDENGKPKRMSGSIQDISVRKDAEAKINASLREKEILLKEINHRTKNNMQVILSLLKMQAKDIKDEGINELYRESYNRIKSMSLIYSNIFNSKDLSLIDTQDYFVSIVEAVLKSYGKHQGQVDVNIQANNINFDIDTAINCGLILNELISNSIKHGISGMKNGLIEVLLELDGKHRCKFIVRDNGIGMSQDLDISDFKSMGLRLVSTLVEHNLGGKLTTNLNKGAEFIVDFNI